MAISKDGASFLKDFITPYVFGKFLDIHLPDVQFKNGSAYGNFTNLYLNSTTPDLDDVEVQFE